MLRAQVEQARWPLAHGRPAAGEQAALADAYAPRGYALYWSGAYGPTPQALQFIDVLRAAGDEGLDPADYDAASLAAAAERLAATRGADAVADAVDFDLRLTASGLRYALHLHGGRVSPRGAGYDLKQGPAALDAAAWLAELASTADVRALIARIEPQFLHYRLLQQALLRYRALASGVGVVALPALPRRSLPAGETYAGAPALRRLLAALGDLPSDGVAADTSGPDTSGGVLDATLVAAIGRFQARHGLEPDGVLGRNTLAALNVPAALRVRQIELTLERWRWLPPFRPREVIVNIPQFRLFALESAEDRVAGTLQMPVITGRAYKKTRTPVFTADIEYVVFRPYWDVPRSIAVEEILPLIRARPGYLERNEMELVRGPSDDSPVVEATPENIAALERGELRVRQRPGDGNTLGLIKFVMPNGYGVYLHGTPGRRGFLLSRRDLSHGCIRVSDPAQLAAYVLQSEPGEWTPEAIEAATHAEESRRVKLAQPVHVMLLYGTALATEDGRILFLDDIYGLDRRLAELLRRAAVTS